MYISTKKGYISLCIDSFFIKQCLEKLDVKIPLKWGQKRYNRDGKEYHITIITPNEYRNNKFTTLPENCKFKILGYAQCEGVAFLVCDYPEGSLYRKKYGLTKKDFHITLGYKNKDNHEIDKSFRQINKHYS